MTNNGNLIRILMAKDTADDRMLFEEALEQTRFANQVEDGQQVMDYLHREIHRIKRRTLTRHTFTRFIYAK